MTTGEETCRSYDKRMEDRRTIRSVRKVESRSFPVAVDGDRANDRFQVVQLCRLLSN